ncbi:MAG: VTT domain-containing protein [Syntrophobacterales bacterium]|nr:VTT domain-containing protein [Syntrophobacterales bacterium]
MTPSASSAANHKARRLFLAAGTLLAAAIMVALVYHWWEPLTELLRAISDRERLQAWLKSAGPWGPFWFILIQSLQVLFAPIPGEATGFLGGFLFGFPLGFVYSTIGLTLGSILAFLAGHWLEKRVVVKIVSPETMQRFDFFMDHQGALVAFLLFLLPGFPKDYLCFILGLSPMSLRLFVVLVFFGRMPGTLMLTLQGAKVYEGEYLMFGVILGCCLVVGGLMYYYRETVYDWIRRLEANNAMKGTQAAPVPKEKKENS